MRIGRAYYNGENYKTADSLFSSVIAKSPTYIQAYLWDANTYTKLDPDTKLGLAKPKFEKLLEVGGTDSVKNAESMMAALTYLSFYHMMNENYSKSKDYYNRMINLGSNKEYKIRGYSGLGAVELRSTSVEKTNEGRLPYLSRATESYNKILAIDPANAAAKSQLTYIRGWESDIKKGINPNEIKGVITNSSNGQPIPYASIRVKDTAAENMASSKGEFKFEIPQGSEVLIISAKGFKTQEIPITKTRVYNVSLGQ
jgi:tetratricopeptide (TPR) repeat protein